MKKMNSLDAQLKKETAVSTLIATGSIEQAAKAAGVGVATIHKWFEDPELQAELTEYGISVKKQGAARANILTSTALETLERNMKCTNPAIEVRAATAILNLVYNNPFINNDEAEEARKYVQAMRRAIATMPDNFKVEFMRALRFEEATISYGEPKRKAEVVIHAEEGSETTES